MNERSNPGSRDGSKGNLIGGFLKGLAVIESFGSERQRQSIADIARATGFDRATARRLALTLVHAGYAEYDGKFFWLTPKTVRLGNAYLYSAELPNILQMHLEQLSSKIHESCSASILEGNEVLYIARASYERVMSINLRVGSRLPIHCSSMGRVLLSTLDEDSIIAILGSGPLQRFTPKTCTDVDKLVEIISHVRRDGYAVVDEELEIGLRSVAIPVVDRASNTVAALNIGTNAARVPISRLSGEYLDQLRKIQSDISNVL